MAYYTKRYSVDWYRGIGAQAILLPKVEDSMLLVHLHTNNDGRLWGISSPENYLKIIEKNRGIYEVITNRKRKVYFDIDRYDTDSLEDCIKEIRTVLPDAEINVSGSRPTKTDSGEQKFSYHIVIQNYHCDTVSSMTGIKEFCREREHLGFDWKVYTTNRNMKCINQSKPGKPIQAYIQGSKDPKHHTITAFFSPDSKNAEKEFEIFDNEPIVPNKIPQAKFVTPRLQNTKDVLSIGPIDLVHLIPDQYDHGITFTVGLYYANLGLGFEDFWSWAKKKDPSSERRIKYLTYHWPKIQQITNAGENRVNKDSIIRILERYFPNIRREYYTRLFLDYSDVPFDVDIKREFVKSTDISDLKRISYIVTAMGSGKTGAVADYVKGKKGSCLFLSCRVSLAQNLKGRLDERFISYDDVPRLREVCRNAGHQFTAKETSQIKKTGIPLTEHLIITPNSAHYVQNTQFETVVIDEFEMFQTVWTSDETHKSFRTVDGVRVVQNNFMANWNTINNILANAKKIIILDAIPSKNSFQYLESLGFPRSEIEVVGSSFKYKEQKVFEVPQIKKWFSKLISLLKAGEKVYIFWPYKNPRASDKKSLRRLSCEQLKDFLIKAVPKRKLNHLIYTADTNKGEQKKDLENVEDAWKDIDLVIVNQSITIGINYNIPMNFHSVFLADTNFVSVRELIQTSRRIRSTKSCSVYYTHLGGCHRDAYFKGSLPSDRKIQNLAENVFNEYKGRNRTTIQTMFSKNHMVFQTTTEKFARLPNKYKNLIGPDTVYDWDSIPDIEDPEVYERLCCFDAESVEDVLRIAKYQFKRMFRGDLDESVFRYYWPMRGIVKTLYNYMRQDVKPQWCEEIINYVLNSTAHFNIKLRPETRRYLDQNFSFLALGGKSDVFLAKGAINSYLNYSVVQWNKKQSRFEINDDFIALYQGLNEIFDIDIYEDDVCMFLDPSEEDENEASLEQDNDDYDDGDDFFGLG